MKKILVVVLVVFTLLGLVSCGGKLEWPDGKLGNMIPQIDGAKGEIGYENLDSLYITLEDISESQYVDTRGHTDNNNLLQYHYLQV